MHERNVGVPRRLKIQPMNHHGTVPGSEDQPPGHAGSLLALEKASFSRMISLEMKLLPGTDPEVKWEPTWRLYIPYHLFPFNSP